MSQDSIRGALALATCSLLASSGAGAAGSDEWDVESAVLFYSEKDRVDVVEPAFTARRDLGDEEAVTVRGTLDTMTGASPNGASITNRPQTFTAASGGKSYTADPDRLPTLDFEDTRVALGADWEKPIGRTARRIVGANASVESDYLSLGGAYTYLRDTKDRLTTWSAGIGGSFDRVSPTGGAPAALQRLSAASGSDDEDDEDSGEGDDDGGGEGNRSNETKLVLDAVVGVTRVLSARSLLQLNYSLSYRNGYLNDPYKLVSLIDGGGATVDYVYENRPGNRLANIIYLKWVYRLTEGVFRTSYRYFTDDWGVRAHTADASYRFELGRGYFVSPYGRYYTQSAADFYRHSLPVADGIPSAVSADYRLAEMNGTTFGFQLGRARDEDSEWSVTLERMKQTGDSHPADAVGLQRGLDLYPDLEAVIIQLNYFARF